MKKKNDMRAQEVVKETEKILSELNNEKTLSELLDEKIEWET